MWVILSLIVTGLVTGSIYSLIGAGLTLTYQTTGIFNFGYGAIAFTCAYIYYMLHIGLGWPIAPAALLTICVFAPALGWILDRFIFRSLSTAADATKIMVTVGVSIFLPALAQWVVQLINAAGGNLPNITLVAIAPGIGPSPAKEWSLGQIHLTSDQVIVLICAAIVALLLWLLLQHTTLGLQMRSVVDRPALAQLRGVNRNRASSAAWVIGTTLAGLAGVVAAPIFNTLDPNVYTVITFVAIAAVVVGRFRSIPVVFIAGMTLGALQNIVVRYSSFARDISGFNSAVPFVVLLAGVAYWGRSQARVAGASLDVEVSNDDVRSGPSWRRMAPWSVGAALLLVWVGFVADSFWLGQVTSGLALSLIFLSFVIMTGLGGMVSLAQAAFVSVAALSAGLAIQHFHAPYLVGVIVGTLVAATLGALVAVPALGLSGLALALSTLAFGLVCDNVLFGWGWLANGLEGWKISRPAIWGLSLSSNRSMALFLMVLIAVVVILIRNLKRTLSGRAIMAVRSSDAAARMSGISPSVARITLFAVGAAVAGLGGIMLATYTQSVTPSTYPTDTGLVWLAAVVLWGIRRSAGAILAGLSVALFPALLANGVHWPSFVPTFLSWNGTQSVWLPNVLFGLGAIQMAKDPDGILSAVGGSVQRQRQRRRARKASRELALADSGGEPVISPVGKVAEPILRSATRSDAGAAPRISSAALRVSNLAAGYGEVQVLFDVSLELSPGTITSLVGANGAGKSTLCGVVSGLISASQGEVELEGRDVGTLRADQRARAGLVLAPESRGIFPTLTVADNLLLQLPDSGDRAKVYERFPALGTRRRVPAGSLSGGEQQMLTMAPLVVHPPRVLIADEPTLGLAPLIALELMGVFEELKGLGVTLLLVEEKAKLVLDVADQVAVLALGRLVWSGPRSAVDQELLLNSYLGRESPQGVARSLEL